MPDTLLIDPLGRSITLHDHTWERHIVKRHGDMAALRELVESLVRTPSQICICPRDPSVRFYFSDAVAAGKLYVVVVDLTSGLVLTAHRVHRMKGSLEWPP